MSRERGNQLNRIVLKGFKSIKECNLELKDINILINPNSMIIPSNGIARMLDIKKVKDNVLNLYAIIGIRKICAEKVTDTPVAIL